MSRRWIRMFFLALASLLLVAAGGAGAAASAKSYGSAEEAVKALVEAIRSQDAKAVLAVLGPEAKSLVNSGDAVADRAARARFVKAYDEANKLEPQGDAKAILSVGKDAWPFPIPVVKAGDAWRFDAKQGAEELVNRRIGRNELSAMQAMQAYVDAQREYYQLNPAKDKLLQYAQLFASTKGKRDGLYFPTKDGERPSPLGALFERRAAAGYKDAPDKSNAYFGYRYRILKAQGPDAPGGAYDYVVRGKMIGGFALVAYPASYGSSGIMTFIVNHEGVVYQKDLGAGTSAIASKMTTFNPDSTWKRQ